jgi:uncharacterized repeat protein (TIGR01451 family)
LCNAFDASHVCTTPFGFDGANNTTNSRTSAELLNADPGAVAWSGDVNMPATSDGSVTLRFVNPQDFLVDSLQWRVNSQASYPILVAHFVPVTALADYHLLDQTSPAFDTGTGTFGSVTAPNHDIDNDARPQFTQYDRGADEIRPLTADLSITKTDGITSVAQGAALTYTVTVGNAGPDTATGAAVVDNLPVAFTNASWTCVASAGSSCAAGSGTGNINTTVTVRNGGTATFTISGTVSSSATGTLTNTATVTVPTGTSDPSLTNNTATDNDTILVPTDLSITKTDSQTLVNRGAQIRYTIVATNNGPNAVTGATITDNFPTGFGGALTGTINWTCTTTGGATCGGLGTGSGNINRTVTMPVGSTVTFTTTSGSVSTTTNSTSVSNTATVTVGSGFLDTNTSNNSATDTDAINGVHVGDLDWTSTNTNATQWSATVTITVHDSNHNPVSGATVTGAWPLFTNIGSCTTNASGQCNLTRTGLSRATTASTSFAVLFVTSSTGAYQVGLNHDPDSGAQASNGTTITAARP